MNEVEDAMMQDMERMRHQHELDDLRQEIDRLRRRNADLEDFLRGAATQFMGMAGR